MPPPKLRIEIIDATEITEVTNEIEAWLAQRLQNERFDPNFASELFEVLDWADAKALLQGGMPSVTSVRKGVFGEVLAAECITEFDGYLVPIKKLRSSITPRQSLPGTDVLAFKLDEAGRIVRAAYIEAKLRTTRDLNAGVEAEAQLHQDIQARFPHLLVFVANQLYALGSPLTSAVRDYMGSRRRGEDLDEFRLHLTWDGGAWSEAVLDRIEDSPPLLQPLTVCALLIQGLAPLIARVYSSVGVRVDPDDD